jgi:predicted ATP-dependent protease
MREADSHASLANAPLIAAEHVQKAIDQQLRRAGSIRLHLLENIRDGLTLVESRGARVGQVNGLSVVRSGEHSFGQVVRITARAWIGHGDVIDIERDVDLAGPLHAKGVLICKGFLGQRYATEVPLSLSASLVFEQSYGAVEGDSASVAETCALLSALSNVPLSQSIAVTGSMNQHGEVQAVGGVNEKIEGFFDVCREQGLSGEQGVVIPASNVRHLMLSHEVVAAVRDGKFHVWAVATIDQALELLTGRESGQRDAAGAYAAGSVNAAVLQRLRGFAEVNGRFRGRDGAAPA